MGVEEEIIDPPSDSVRSDAEKGEYYAQYRLGRLYEAGSAEFPKNLTRALYWAEQSAAQGYAPAQYDAGRLLRVEHSRGIQDSSNDQLTIAFKWFLKSAQGGYVPAMTALGVCYEKGIGTTRNPHDAMEWHRRVSEANGRRQEDRPKYRLVPLLDDELLSMLTLGIEPNELPRWKLNLGIVCTISGVLIFILCLVGGTATFAVEGYERFSHFSDSYDYPWNQHRCKIPESRIAPAVLSVVTGMFHIVFSFFLGHARYQLSYRSLLHAISRPKAIGLVAGASALFGMLLLINVLFLALPYDCGGFVSWGPILIAVAFFFSLGNLIIIIIILQPILAVSHANHCSGGCWRDHTTTEVL